MRRNTGRRPPHLELGVLLLISELFSVGYNVIPPVTLFTIIAQIILYIDVLDVPWKKWDVCISGKKVLYDRKYSTLILSTVEHADDMHLYYNMISFLLKGRTLEPLYGSANFALLLAVITVMTSSIYVALASFLSNILQDSSFLHSCSIGFSGVIFALKILTTANSYGTSFVSGFRVPTKYAAWAELIAIHVLVPNASFLGHLAGILAGLLYVKTPLKKIIDSTLTNITGIPIGNRYESDYYYQDYDYR